MDAQFHRYADQDYDLLVYGIMLVHKMEPACCLREEYVLVEQIGHLDLQH